jgi:5-oxoprolinase (ATP-hydrolysing) subunit A
VNSVVVRVDLNCDMGESYGIWKLGRDEEVMPFVTSANIACGFHASDPHVMRKTVLLAKKHGVGVGAHTGFPDREGFGRRYIQVTKEELKDDIIYQVGALAGFLKANGMKLQHVKPHGAMYTVAVNDEELSEGIVEGIQEYDPELLLFAMPNSLTYKIAEKRGLPVVPEGFVELNYLPNGSLALERAKKAWDPEEVARRFVRLLKEGKVSTVTGETIPQKVKSVCVHGDAPNTPEILKALEMAMSREGIERANILKLL